MGLRTLKTKPGGNFDRAPAGNHVAILVAIVELGFQENDFQGKVTVQERGYFCWELVNEATKSGDRHVIGMELTLSMNEKAKLRKLIESWRGKKLNNDENFNPIVLLGKGCLLNVVEKQIKDKTFSEIDSVSPLPKGTVTGEPQHAQFLFEVSSIKEDGVIPPLPEWLPFSFGKPITDLIKQRLDPPIEDQEEEEEKAPASNDADGGDNIPF